MDFSLNIIKADLSNKTHCEELIYLLNIYATDIMGGGESLSEYTRINLATELHKRAGSHVFIAYTRDGGSATLHGDLKRSKKSDEGNEKLFKYREH